MTGSFWWDLLIGIAAALVLVWLLLVIVLAVAQPRSGLLREPLRLLPDVLRLVRGPRALTRHRRWIRRCRQAHRTQPQARPAGVRSQRAPRSGLVRRPPRRLRHRARTLPRRPRSAPTSPQPHRPARACPRGMAGSPATVPRARPPLPRQGPTTSSPENLQLIRPAIPFTSQLTTRRKPPRRMRGRVRQSAAGSTQPNWPTQRPVMRIRLPDWVQNPCTWQPMLGSGRA